MHERGALEPVNAETLSSQEKANALRTVTFLTEKNDGRVKARTCAENLYQQRGSIKPDSQD
jgi:hypothetical protein